MSSQSVSGSLSNGGLGSNHWNIVSKHSLLTKIPLEIQTKAFALALLVQGIFMFCYPHTESEGFSKRKAVEVLASYLSISTSIYLLCERSLRENIISCVVLGTTQLALITLLRQIFAAMSVQKLAFGKRDWAKYFGDVGNVPSIPKDTFKKLKAECPFHPGKQVKDTHMLVLIPKTVDGKPFTLNLLQKLIQKPKKTAATDFQHYSEPIKERLGKTSIEKPYWILITKDVIPSSRNKRYNEHKRLIQEKGANSYKLPRAIEAATSLLMHRFKTAGRFHNTSSFTYTNCREKIKEKYPVLVGSDLKETHIITYNRDRTDETIGVVAIQKL